MKVAGHQNVCLYADDEPSLYKLWDDDLKNYSRRRQWSEGIGFSLLVGAYLTWRVGQAGWAAALLGLGIAALFSAIKYMIDESNINYLMHQWDLTEAIHNFRVEERRKLGSAL